MRMELRRRAIDKLYKRRDRIEMAECQRENNVWSPDKKRMLIDTILREWHLPKIYFRKIDENTYECVDGQQRLLSIWEFCDNKLRLNRSTAEEFGGYTYKELNDEVSDRFDDYELDVEEIEEATEVEVNELFLRLQLGEPLNTAEKLNAILGGMRNFCKTVAVHDFLKNKIAIRDTRYAHFDIATKWLFIEARGIQPQMRFPQLEGFMRENSSFSLKSELAKNINESLKYLNKAFPEKCSKLRNRANVLSVCMLATRVIKQGISNNTAKNFGDFVENFFTKLGIEVEKGAQSKETGFLEYQEAISYGSTGGDSIKSRISILTRRLATDYSEFAPLLCSAPDEYSDDARDLSEKGKEIQKLVYDVNKKYSAESGEDLFKMTNESVAALSNVSAVCDNLKQYGEFIDNVYKLIYEGSGDCKRLPHPPAEFVMDVKNLRTELRHDTDHGKSKEVIKKRKKTAAVFEKYSGKKTTSECGPEDFLVTQLRILTAMRDFLAEL